MAMSILPKFLTLKWNISRTIWRIEVGDGSGFFAFFTLFHLSLTFFRPEFPFNSIVLISDNEQHTEFELSRELSLLISLLSLLSRADNLIKQK